MKMIYRVIWVFIFTCKIFLYDASAQTINLSIVAISDTDPKHLEIIKDSLQSFYNCKVFNSHSIKISQELISKSFDEDQEYKFDVLNARIINNRLNELNKDEYDFVIGVTDSALTIGKKFLSSNYFIRGLANDSLGTATISTFKIRNEAENDIDFVSTLAKVAKHELGHLLGMAHCGSESCLMVSGYRFEKMNENYCEDCLNKIDKQYLIIE